MQRDVVTVRTLPIRLVPGVGEGLDSYLEVLAQRSGAAWADMLDAVGLDTDGRGRTPGVYQWLSELTPAQQQSLSSACGIDPSRRDSLSWPQEDGLRWLHLRGGGVSL
jgi:hypothetical protein